LEGIYDVKKEARLPFSFSLEHPVDKESKSIQMMLDHVERHIEENDANLDRIQAELEDVQDHIADNDRTIERMRYEIIRKQTEMAAEDALFWPEYQERVTFYSGVVKSPVSPEAKEISNLLKERKYAGIVVYPQADQWEPNQRLQQFLKEFARRGFLCFICDRSSPDSIREVEERLFVVSQSESLLQALQTHHVLVVNSWLLQNAWIDFLPHKTLWYDVQNRVDFFRYYDRNMLAKHVQVLHEADIVTYSERQFIEYVHERNDAIYLPNATRTNHWKERCETVITQLVARPSCLKVFANREFRQHVGVFAATFLDYDGGNYYSGGAERYLVDLHEVCGELGLKLDVYQYGHFSWYRKYKDIDVYSLGHETLDIRDYSMKNVIDFNRRYVYAAEEKFMLNFYSAFFQAYPGVAHPSIGISHGVAWDHRGCEFEEPAQFWQSNLRFLESAKQIQTIVSVDTNTPNWYQTISFKTGQRIFTIPNYVDPNEFFPVKRKDDGKIRIVYPRRLYEARGLYLTLEVAERILKHYPQTEFHFVGKGFDEDVNHIEKAISRWPGRMFCYHRDPNDMHQVYKDADIVLIPTLYSEGTSLSCLEACATGNVVIATRIGGLTDIVIDRFNGLLITPDSESLEKAIVECVEQPELRTRLGRNALEVSKAFDKASWKERWKAVIKKQLANSGYEPQYGADISSVDSILFQLGPNTKAEEWVPEAAKCLMQGKAVFVKGDIETEKESSFGRIQWISDHEELYFQPEIRNFD